jgi:enoyl-CoA hydratase/carnithine racemase
VSATKALSGYANRSRIARCERDDHGILVITLHTDGGELRWGADDDDDYRLNDLFSDVADDPENRVVVLTGTGSTFCAQSVPGHSARYHNPDTFERVFRFQRKLHMSFLDIEVPIVAALNGPVLIHSELPLMSDVVLASETVIFQDGPHFPVGIPPGDGVHVVWPMILGPLRAKYFMLTGQKIGATEALSLGVVNEVLPGDQLLDRALEIAGMIAERPPLTVRYTRRVLNLEMRRAISEDLDHALALEGLSIVQIRGWRMPFGGCPPAWTVPDFGPTLPAQPEPLTGPGL